MADPNAPTIPFGSQPTRSFDGSDTTGFTIHLGQLLLGRYRAEKQISTTSAARPHGVKQGGQAEVWRCTQDSEPKKVVVKFHPGQQIVKEDILKKIRDFHGNKYADILQVFDITSEPEGFYEVQEVAEGGDLTGEDGKHRWTEEELTSLLPQMLNSLVTLHEADIIHRDVKPSNFFFRDTKKTDLVLGDFGIASAVQGGGTPMYTDARGTSIYLAPELFVPPGEKKVLIGPASDYFSLGMTLIALVSGEEFLEECGPLLHSYKTNAKVARPKGISARFGRLLEGLLHPKSDLRWGHAEVRGWLRGDDVPVAAFMTAEFEYRLSSELVARTREELGKLLYYHTPLGRVHLTEGTLLDNFHRGHQDLVTVLRRIQRLVSFPDAQVLALAYTLNPKLPFRFAHLQEAQSAEQFVALVDASGDNWNIGRQHLFGGSLLWWVEGQPAGFPVAEEWANLEEAFRNRQDAGFEHFLHMMVPDLAWPELEIEPQSLVDLKFTEASVHLVQFRLLRRGRGHLEGEIRILEPVHGIALSSPLFRGPDTRIGLSIPLQNASPGETRGTTLQVSWNKPYSKKELPLRATVIVPWNRVYNSSAIWAALVAVFYGGFRALVGYALKDDSAWVLTDSELNKLAGWPPPVQSLLVTIDYLAQHFSILGVTNPIWAWTLLGVLVGALIGGLLGFNKIGMKPTLSRKSALPYSKIALFVVGGVLAIWTVRAVGLLVSGGAAKSTNDAPEQIVDRGACPYEGCKYGERWMTRQNVDVYAAPPDSVGAPLSSLRKITTIHAGTWVRTETGVLLARRLEGRVNATNDRTPHGAAVKNTLPLKGGQIIPLYSYIGEGCWRGWISGQFLAICDVTPQGRAQQEWWVQIRTARGTKAWTNSAPSAFVSDDGLNSELAGKIGDETEGLQTKLATIDTLLKGGANLNGDGGKYGIDPVGAVIKSNDVDLLKALIARGLNIKNIRSCPAYSATGGSVLHPGGDLMLNGLLENGMRLDCLQEPPLHAFLRFGIGTPNYPVDQAVRVAEVLIKHGANVKQKDSQGKSIFDLIDTAKEPARMLALKVALANGAPEQSQTAKVESPTSDVTAPKSFAEMKEQVETAINDGKYDCALLDAERAVRLYPGNDQARSLLERVRRIRSILK